MEGQAHAKNALINTFVRGGSNGRYEPEDICQSHQLHLNVERIRVPEAWFQPSMFAIDCAGVGEIGGWLLNGFEEEERRRMMQVGNPRLISDSFHLLLYLQTCRSAQFHWFIRCIQLMPS